MRRPSASQALLRVSAVVTSAALLSACGTGLEAQTYQPRTPANGTNASVGEDLALRDLAVQPVTEAQGAPAGVEAVMTGLIVNTGEEGDSLVKVSSEAASVLQLISAAGAPELAVPAGGTSGTEWAVAIGGLTRTLLPGQFVDVTLEFARAGRTVVSVPVRKGEIDLDTRERLQNPYGEGGSAEGDTAEPQGDSSAEPSLEPTLEPSTEPSAEPTATPSG